MYPKLQLIDMEDMKDLNVQLKRMTSDVVAATFNKDMSFFSQDNLMPSIKFVDDWEKGGMSATEKPRFQKKMGSAKQRRPLPKRRALSSNLMKAMAESHCFPFPSLLPTVGKLRN